MSVQASQRRDKLATDHNTSELISDYSNFELTIRQRITFLVAGGCAISFIVFLFYRSILLAIPAAILIHRVEPLYRRWLAEKRLRELNVQFQDLLTSLSASVTAGRQMDAALIEACDDLSLLYPDTAPIMTELYHMRRSILHNHTSDRILLEDFSRRTGSEDIRSFVQVYLTCRSTGGDLERIISHTAGILTEKMKINEQINVITAQKKLEGRLISLMPLAMLLALNLVSPGYISALYTTITGRLIMTVCLAGLLVGVCLMEKISDVEV